MAILSLLTALFPGTDPAKLYATIVDDVARVVRNRLYEDGSGKADTFTDGTDPDKAAVKLLIEDAAQILNGSFDIGDGIPVKAQPFARRLIARMTAYEIERGGDEFNQARLDALHRDIVDTRAQFSEALQDLADGGDPTRTNEQTPAFSFPAAVPFDW